MLHRAAVGAASVLLLLTAACDDKAKTGDASSTPPATAATATGSPTPEPTTDAAGAAAGPCDVLTTAEVSAALGMAVSDGKERDFDPPLGGHECFWATPAPPILTFQVVLRTAPDITAGGQTPADLYDSTVAAFTTSQGLSAAPGIGDKAQLGVENGYVLKGGTYMMTAIGAKGHVDEAVALKTLTASAAAKL